MVGRCCREGDGALPGAGETGFGGAAVGALINLKEEGRKEERKKVELGVEAKDKGRRTECRCHVGVVCSMSCHSRVASSLTPRSAEGALLASHSRLQVASCVVSPIRTLMRAGR